MADEEFLNTLRNIGTKWYQCPNGHAYVIGECGLAMIESRCPECGEKIGGKDHTLLATNKLVDFDLDVKNNINITPVKVLKKSKDKNKEKNNKESNKEEEKEEEDGKEEEKIEDDKKTKEKNNKKENMNKEEEKSEEKNKKLEEQNDKNFEKNKDNIEEEKKE